MYHYAICQTQVFHNVLYLPLHYHRMRLSEHLQSVIFVIRKDFLFLDRSRHQSFATFPPIPFITSEYLDGSSSNAYSSMNSSHMIVALPRFPKRRKTYPTNMSSALACHMVASVSLFDQPWASGTTFDTKFFFHLIAKSARRIALGARLAGMGSMANRASRFQALLARKNSGMIGAMRSDPVYLAAVGRFAVFKVGRMTSNIGFKGLLKDIFKGLWR